MQVKLSSVAVFLLFIGTVVISLVFSTGLVDPGDGLSHFNISKFSWKYPTLFLDHWGKPLYTLLSSPFAQFGYNGLLVFNLLCAVLTGYFLLRSAKNLGIEHRWLALLCLFAAPVYFKMVIAGLTEVLFAMICAWAISVLLERKFITAAILLSFLPFARPEAYVVLPFFATFILIKNWKALPWLLTAVIIYSLIGTFVFDDFFWLINRDPYADAEIGVYGFGQPLDFLKSSKDILGLPITICFVIGLILVSFFPEEKMRSRDRSIQYWLLLILPAMAIMAVHSFLWWKGLNGSAGLKRVIATSAPMVALVTGAGLDRIAALIPKRQLSNGFLGSIAVLLCFTLYDRVDIIVEFNRKQRTTQQASEWVAKELKEGERLFYLDPLVGYTLDLDPYDNGQAVLLWSREPEGQNSMKSGDVIFWETHFAPQEGGMAKNDLMKDTELDLVYQDSPEVPYPMRNTFYEVMIFRKK